MVCKACQNNGGNKPCNVCGNTPKVVEILNEEAPILFHTVELDASIGTEEDFPPKNGLYKNVLLVYKANDHKYLYSSDGIPSNISSNTIEFNAILDRPKYAGETMTSDTDIPDVNATAEAVADEKVAAEAAIRAAADQALTESISGFSSELAAEKTARENADNAINQEIGNITSDLDSEMTAREEADEELSNRITAEKEARELADAGLTSSISSETTARTEADTALGQRIDGIVSDLQNYYTKSETYTKDEVNALVSQIPKFSIEVVETLPTEDISLTTIYLVPAEEPKTGNSYDEFIYVNNAWEQIGSTAIDLTNYYTKGETDGLLSVKADQVDLNTLSGRVDGIEPVLISAPSQTAEGMLVPNPTLEQVMQMHNGIVAGKQVVLTDTGTNCHYVVTQADSMSDIISITIDYFNTAIVTYTVEGNTVTTTVYKFSQGGGGNAVWGQITGVLGSQADLKIALDSKAAKSEVPKKTSDLTNDSNFITLSDVPVATTSTLGLIKVGDNLSITADGTLSAEAATEVAWGNIAGTLSAQTDLQNALDAKVNSSDITELTAADVDQIWSEV